jgi:hypothetical protein
MQAKIFVSEMDKMFLEIGAEKQKEEREYILQTKGGPLWVLVDQNVAHSCCLFGRFLELDNAKEAFPDLSMNRWSGKFNQYRANTGVSPQAVVRFFKRQLEELI